MAASSTSAFDFFDTLAHTDDPRVTPAQRAHRERLRTAMQRHGFANYDQEWWHYTFKPEPTPATYFDIPLRASAAAGHGKLSAPLVPPARCHVIDQSYPRSRNRRTRNRAEPALGGDLAARAGCGRP